MQGPVSEVLTPARWPDEPPVHLVFSAVDVLCGRWRDTKVHTCCATPLDQSTFPEASHGCLSPKPSGSGLPISLLPGN